MGLLKRVSAVKLIIGILANKDSLFKKAEDMLEKKYGRIDYRSNIIKFDFTDYYSDEMGPKLSRKFISFQKLFDPLRIAKIKLQTNMIENKFKTAGRRNINIDPGFINEWKLVLASTKDNLQRIYLGRGIYAEITLYYKNSQFMDFIWTYPDYKTEEYKRVFQDIRKLFREQIGRQT